MNYRSKLVLSLGLLIVIFSFVDAHPASYSDFFRNFVEIKTSQVSRNAVELGQMMDGLDNENVSIYEAVARAEEMEYRAESYIVQVLELRPAEGNLKLIDTAHMRLLHGTTFWNYLSKV